MDLTKKKVLAAKTLAVGKSRILFNVERTEEIKEAITKQDIRDLHKAGAILIKPIHGRKTIVFRKTRRLAGSVRKKIKNRKQEYVKLTRKLRAYVFELKKQGKLTLDQYYILRKEIKSKSFKNKRYLKERISLLSKWKQ